MNAFTDAPSTWEYGKLFREKILQKPRALEALISRLRTADSAKIVVFRGLLLL